MKPLVLTLGLLLAAAGTASAQDKATAKPAAKPVATMAHPAHNCMMADDKTWESLKLSADQMTKVKAIQAECHKECGAMMKDDPKMAAMMDKHETKVKEVLTKEQYDQWMKWCTSQAKMPEKKPMEKK